MISAISSAKSYLFVLWERGEPGARSNRYTWKTAVSYVYDRNFSPTRRNGLLRFSSLRNNSGFSISAMIIWLLAKCESVSPGTAILWQLQPVNNAMFNRNDSSSTDIRHKTFGVINAFALVLLCGWYIMWHSRNIQRGCDISLNLWSNNSLISILIV